MAVTAYSPSFWSKVVSRLLQKNTIFRSVASFSESGSLKSGVDVDRPYRTELVAENYTKLTALTAQTLTATSEKLTINKQKAITFELDDIDKMQNTVDTLAIYSKDSAKTLAVAQDAEFLYEALSAQSTVDASDFGGTSGTGVTLNTSNVDGVLSAANRKLDVQNVDREGRYLAHSPQFLEVLWERVAGKESMLGDKTAEFASQGRYAGFDLYLTNNLTASSRWTPADNPSDGATSTIESVVITFNTTVSGAGSIDIGANTAGTIDNLVAFINAGGVGDDSTYVSLSAANRKIVQQWVAVDGATYIEVRAKGSSYMSTATSEALDLWSVPTQHNMAGKKGAVDMVVQKEINAETDRMLSAGKFSTVVGLLTVFGIKSFNRGTYELCDIKLDTSSF